MEPDWLVWARQIQSLAQSGLAFTRDAYDRERYEALRLLAAEMMAARSGGNPARIEALFAEQTGYATPKVDVRGAVFDRDGRVLLVREAADGGRWTLPGGWADVNQAPSECVAREVLEEAGIAVRVRKLACVYDRARHPHQPPYPFHIYKMFFVCEPLDGVEHVRGDGHETTAAALFARDEVPEAELSTGRVLPFQIRRLFEHWRHPELPTDFD
ncbi:NUDIX hydrolase [Azospirillum picis]|uniref:ADP-ribose pyrophosphatase YjhB (NUDIX family) n=1 Tax=Azospirillum picis TaxID=488438 RepID=A0ABU0MLH3_9PROT|nr:NUDIX hydrolase [Azospirillum picis]MBP2301068.1 ADP-ribose pyrophosphatase YjhB (NUDIX family) [Azospirillum picis]MDQ0534312.1 ADP-ribose pyrophosphatase YjhB (NUDIX family) [Azospirillum picis]